MALEGGFAVVVVNFVGLWVVDRVSGFCVDALLLAIVEIVDS